MSNISLKVTIKEKWRSQNFDLLSLSSGQLWGAPVHPDIILKLLVAT